MKRPHLSPSPILTLCLFLASCGGGHSGSGSSLKRPDVPGVFQDRSTFKLQPGIQYLQASEQLHWDWDQHKLTVGKPLPSHNFDQGSILVGDDSAPFAARVTKVLVFGSPRVLQVEALSLSQMIQSGDVDFRLTPDWRRANPAPSPAGGPKILPDGTIAFEDFTLADLAIDSEGKVAPNNSTLLGAPFYQKQQGLERLKTDQIRNGHIRITLTKGLLRIVPTGDYQLKGLSSPSDAVAKVSFAMTVLYRFQIRMEVSGPMELAFRDELLQPLSLPIPLAKLKTKLKLEVPLSLHFKSSSRTKTTFLYGRERELRVTLEFNSKQTQNPFNAQSSLLSFSEVKDIKWDERGKVFGEWSISPQLQLSFYQQQGPYLSFDFFARNQAGIPWSQDPNDIVIGFSGKGGLELGDRLTRPFLGLKQMDSPQLFAEFKGFDLLGPKGNPPPNSPPSALSFGEFVPREGKLLRLQAQDRDGDPLLFQIQDQPSDGVLSILDKHSGILRYTPKDSFQGEDVFTYSVFDGKTQSDPVPVLLTATDNSAPEPAFSYSSKAREVRVDATRSKDAETPSSELLVRWDWTNDGIWDTEWLQAKVTSHRYPSTGSYVIRLEVRDSDLLSSTLTQPVIVGSKFTGSGTIINSLGMRLNLIPAGTFWMGSLSSEPMRDPKNEKRHKVTLTQPFYMGQTEVTQGQWFALMGTRPWKGKRNIKEGSDYAASFISWEDGLAFCKALTKKEGITYRLPTEAEWERACRAGTQTIFSYGDDDEIQTGLRAHAWYFRNAWDRLGMYGNPRRVAKKAPNPWGLYDLYGNVYEPCSDFFAPYSGDAQTDPKGPPTGKNRVYRGGYIASRWFFCRSASRVGFVSTGSFTAGLRVVRSVR